MKNILEGINSRLGYTQKHIGDMEDRIMEINFRTAERKTIKKMKTV